MAASLVVAETLMAESTSEHDFVVHLSPAWRDRADFIINANIEEEDLPKRYEQLWVRRLGERWFEICCIPFFVHDLALGDEVETAPKGDRQYLLTRVVKPSGGYTFRVWFGDSNLPTARNEVVKAARDRSCEFEWFSENLLALDARDDRRAQELADFLHEREQLGHLTYETGRTR